MMGSIEGVERVPSAATQTTLLSVAGRYRELLVSYVVCVLKCGWLKTASDGTTSTKVSVNRRDYDGVAICHRGIKPERQKR